MRQRHFWDATYDTKTGNESTHHHMNPRVHGSDLNDVTNDEHDDTERKTLSSTEPVGCAAHQRYRYRMLCKTH
jgi:hypothetical protein